MLRLTRRASVWPDPGAIVVVWTRRNHQGQPMGCAGNLRCRPGQWQQAWDSAAQWARNPGDAERAGEVAILPLEQWRLLYPWWCLEQSTPECYERLRQHD